MEYPVLNPKRKIAQFMLLYERIEEKLSARFTHQEIVDWLETEHGLIIALSTYEKYLAQCRLKKSANPTSEQSEHKPPNTLIKPIIAPEPESTIAPDSDDGDASPKLSARQKREAFADRIMSKSTINPLLKK